MSLYIENWENQSKDQLDQIDNWLLDLKELDRHKKEEITSQQMTLHKEVFSEIDCISCANCCKSAPPLLTSSDIKRIANHLGISKKQFTNKYVLVDLNGERSFNYIPCQFLEENGACSIYEIRPEACRRYPHTDESDILKRRKLNMANAVVCPASYHILQQLSSIPLDK